MATKTCKQLELELRSMAQYAIYFDQKHQKELQKNDLYPLPNMCPEEHMAAQKQAHALCHVTLKPDPGWVTDLLDTKWMR